MVAPVTIDAPVVAEFPLTVIGWLFLVVSLAMNCCGMGIGFAGALGSAKLTWTPTWTKENSTKPAIARKPLRCFVVICDYPFQDKTLQLISPNNCASVY